MTVVDIRDQTITDWRAYLNDHWRNGVAVITSDMSTAANSTTLIPERASANARES